jgi:hypothetical protein
MYYLLSYLLLYHVCLQTKAERNSAPAIHRVDLSFKTPSQGIKNHAYHATTPRTKKDRPGSSGNTTQENPHAIGSLRTNGQSNSTPGGGGDDM